MSESHDFDVDDPEDMVRLYRSFAEMKSAHREVQTAMELLRANWRAHVGADSLHQTCFGTEPDEPLN